MEQAWEKAELGSAGSTDQPGGAKSESGVLRGEGETGEIYQEVDAERPGRGGCLCSPEGGCGRPHAWGTASVRKVPGGTVSGPGGFIYAWEADACRVRSKLVVSKCSCLSF